MYFIISTLMLVVLTLPILIRYTRGRIFKCAYKMRLNKVWKMKAEGEYFKSVLFMLVILAGIYVYFRFCTNDYQGMVVWFNDHYTVKYFFPFVTAYFVIMNFAYNKEKDKQKILSDQVMSNLNILNGRVQSEGVIEKPEKILKDIKYELDNRPEKVLFLKQKEEQKQTKSLFRQ